MRDIESASKKVKSEIDRNKTPAPPGKKSKISYATYTAQDRASIGHYSSQHGPMAASRYFTKKFGRSIPEASARCFKKEYLLKLKENVGTTKALEVIKELRTY